MNKTVIKSPISESEPELYFKAWWMEPNGTLHQLYKIRGFGHWDFAKAQLKKWGVPSDDIRMQQPITNLMDKGWIKLTWNYRKDKALEYNYARNIPINPVLFAKINKLALEVDATKLVDDNLDKDYPLHEGIFPKDFNRHQPGTCISAAAMATAYFLKKGIKDFTVIEGFVSMFPEQEQEDWEPHTWIKFNNGRIFDPTKNQWKKLGHDPKQTEYKYVKGQSGTFTPEQYIKLCRIQGDLEDLNENIDWHKHAKFEAYVYRNPDGGAWNFWFWRNNKPAGEIMSIDRDGHIWGFGVQRSLQGTGLGKAMLNYAFEKTGLGYFTLDSVSANSFYHKIGGERKKHPYKSTLTRFVIRRDKLQPSSIKFEDRDTSPTKARNKFHGRSGFDRHFDPWPSINENIESLDERLSYADLYDATDDNRIEKSKKVRVQPLLVTTENNNEVWKFSYTSAERSEYKDSGGKIGHKGNIYFFKDSIEPGDNAEDLDCMVDCDCKDFRFRWAYANAQDDASFIGAKSLNKAINRPPVKTNPERKKQLCKHLAGLAKYLTTNIDRARQRAHLRRRPVNIFETMDKLANKGKFTATYDDDYNVKEFVEPVVDIQEVKVEEPLSENLQKVGFSLQDEHPDMPINWRADDTWHPWNVDMIKMFLSLPDNFSAIYKSIIKVDDLNPNFISREEFGYEWNQFKRRKGGFPPIVVVRELDGKLTIADGNHRVKWAQESGYKTIGAWVVDKMIQNDINRRKPIKETRIISPEESLEEGYITLYHGTTWPIALKAKKGELGPQNLKKLVSDVLVNVFHEKPQDAEEIYRKEIKKNSGRPVPSQNVLFLTGDRETAERYARSTTKYGGEIFLDILGNYIWDKNRNTEGDLSDILKSHLMTDQPAVVTVNIPLSMVFTHPNWNTPVRDRIRKILQNVRKNPELRKYINDINIEVFVSEKIPAKFVQRIDKIKSVE